MLGRLWCGPAAERRSGGQCTRQPAAKVQAGSRRRRLAQGGHKTCRKGCKRQVQTGQRQADEHAFFMCGAGGTGRLLTLHRALYDAVLVNIKRAGRRAPENLGVQAVAGGQSGILRADLSELRGGHAEVEEPLAAPRLCRRACRHLWLALQAGCRSGRICPCLSGWAARGLAGVGLAARACWARRCSSWPASGQARDQIPLFEGWVGDC